MRGEKRLIYKDLIGLLDVNTRQIFHLKLDRRRVSRRIISPIRWRIVIGRPVWILETSLGMFEKYSTRDFRNETLQDLKVI